MPITIGTLRFTVEPVRKAVGAMKTALTAPGAVCVSTSGTAQGGTVALDPVTNAATRARFWGYSIKAAAVGEQPAIADSVIVEGFAGLTQGAKVYIGNDGALTETAPTTEYTETVDADGGKINIPIAPIGIAVRSTAIFFYPVGPQL